MVHQLWTPQDCNFLEYTRNLNRHLHMTKHHKGAVYNVISSMYIDNSTEQNINWVQRASS